MYLSSNKAEQSLHLLNKSSIASKPFTFWHVQVVNRALMSLPSVLSHRSWRFGEAWGYHDETQELMLLKERVFEKDSRSLQISNWWSSTYTVRRLVKYFPAGTNTWFGPANCRVLVQLDRWGQAASCRWDAKIRPWVPDTGNWARKKVVIGWGQMPESGCRLYLLAS